MRGALLRNPGDDTLEVVDDLEIGDPGPGQVKIKITNTGVCHSDLSVMNGTIPQPAARDPRPRGRRDHHRGRRGRARPGRG